LVCVDAGTQCYVNGNQLTFNLGSGLIPVLGDCIAVTTWNDTRQQNILTQVFVGPVQTTTPVVEGFDETNFDSGTTSFGPGSFDYASSAIITINDIMLERIVTDPNRLWVTLNGNRLFYGDGFTLNGYELVLPQALSATDVVMITEFTNSIVPNAMAFRIFQDMRGVQAVYRITPATTTLVAQTVSQGDDIIYVDNAAALSEPRPEDNIWGVVMIEGERIMYRVRDVNTNTISSLLRGTAGTAAASHPVGVEVTDMGRGNLLPAQYQNTVVYNTFLADGSETLFVASNLELAYDDSTTVQEAVEVYVGGILTRTGYTITGDTPVTVQFVTAPPAGVEVTILVRQGLSSWYEPGATTPSNGQPLQITETAPARFLRGL
jgi:hypothetical protein